MPGVRHSVGAHPNIVFSQSNPALLAGVLRTATDGLSRGLVVGIGEAGVDLERKVVPDTDVQLQAQGELLLGQASIAARLGLPLVLHCRGHRDGKVAWRECLETLRLHVPRSQVVHRHCFTGGLQEMLQ